MALDGFGPLYSYKQHAVFLEFGPFPVDGKML
jgi:hypothetical protein